MPNMKIWKVKKFKHFQTFQLIEVNFLFDENVRTKKQKQ